MMILVHCPKCKGIDLSIEKDGKFSCDSCGRKFESIFKRVSDLKSDNVKLRKANRMLIAKMNADKH